MLEDLNIEELYAIVEIRLRQLFYHSYSRKDYEKNMARLQISIKESEDVIIQKMQQDNMIAEMYKNK